MEAAIEKAGKGVLRVVGLLSVSALASWTLGYGQNDAPPERPRARPPSMIADWADWEEGEELLKRIEVPAAPILAPESAIDSFTLAPGYRIELVAAEPMVQKPIFFEFDAEGRIWVVEYQGYMRDLMGSGEGAPICRVVVLEDTDEDGKADKSTVFLDKLVMPRSLSFVEGGVLVQEPPNVWFCEDIDGDLVADKKTKVGEMGFAGNPQHTANGLRYGIDNWLHCADSPSRYRWDDGRLIEEKTVKRGQFGVTFDEAGRFYSCYQDKALFGDIIPAEYLLRNPNYHRVFERAGNNRDSFGVDVNLSTGDAQTVFPIRVTPAVTLGALELRDDGTLETYTIVSGTCYYGGHQFPDEARGNFFVPESGGHLMGRLTLNEGLDRKASRYYPEGQEFLASTDERFRPVNARVGPDGALYIADMYHGIIEHVIFMVPWLEKQIKERKLDVGNDHGRLWRVVAEDRPIDRSSPSLSDASDSELVGLLSHPNMWHRLTAQRLLVQRNSGSKLLKLAVREAAPLGQLHALWTLDGIGTLDTRTRLEGLSSTDERVRAAAVRLSEGDVRTLGTLLGLKDDPSRTVRLQLVLSLGTFDGSEALGLMASLSDDEDHPLFRTAVVTGLSGRELEYLENGYASDSVMTNQLAQCVLEESEPSRVRRLTELLDSPDIDTSAILAAFSEIPRKEPLELASEPKALTILQQSSDFELRGQALQAVSQLRWPGYSGPEMLTREAPPLTREQERLVAMGQGVYEAVCMACHQPNGGGSPNVAPPLAGSEWVEGPVDRLTRIVLQGVYGPIEVKGQTWNLAMPGIGASGQVDDEEIAGVLSYIRRSWGNAAGPVDPARVKEIRAETEGRTLPWRAEELEALSGESEQVEVIVAGLGGSITLPASKARVYGQKLGYRASLDVLAPWWRSEDVAEWHVEVPEAGAYEVNVLLAADDASAGDKFALETDGSVAFGTVLSTGDYKTFKESPAGVIQLKAGVNRLLLRPEGPLKRELADVRAVRLSPVK